MTIKEFKKVIKKHGLKDSTKIRVVVKEYLGDLRGGHDDIEYDLKFEKDPDSKEIVLRAITGL